MVIGMYRKVWIGVSLIGMYFLIWLNACQLSNRSKPNIGNIDLSLKIQRFEKDLFTCDTIAYQACFAALEEKYPHFYPLYINNLLAIRTPRDTGKLYEMNLRNFIANANLRALYDTVMLKYPDVSSLERDFTTAFKYYKYYFPQRPVPEIITHISEFGPAAATFDSTTLAISLDMFLGKDFVYYASIGLPKFMTYRLRPEYILPNAMKAWSKANYEPKASEVKMIDRMVEEGKVLYFLDLVLPDMPDSLKIGYSAKGLQWCVDNEKEMWSYFIEKNLLFSSKSLEYLKYINDAPTTTGMPPESPGQTGIWLGWQIVRHFMQQNPDIEPEELMLMTDGQEILKRSKYKPGR